MNIVLIFIVSLIQYTSVRCIYLPLSQAARIKQSNQTDTSKMKIYSRLQVCDKINCFTSAPRGFSIDYKKVNKHEFEIEFNYTVNDYYNKYFMTIKNHNKKEFITKKVNLDKKSPNVIKLNKFLEDQYIICIVLYSTNYDVSNEFPPISTSDMCVDMFIGDFLVINSEEDIRFSGLLAPVLLSIAFLCLVAITIIDKLRRAEISKCCGKMNEKIAVDSKSTEQIKLKTNAYYSNKYGLREDLLEVFIYYDQVEFVLDDNTNYYLKKEMFYFIQNYLQMVATRLESLSVKNNVNFLVNEKIHYQDYYLARQQKQPDAIYDYKFV